jgi:hypothetical protein
VGHRGVVHDVGTGSEGVEEVVEEGPEVVAVDELLRQAGPRPVEAEVPGEGLDSRHVHRSGQREVQDGQALHLVAVLSCVLVGDAATHVVSDQGDPAVAQGVGDESVHVLRQGGLVVAAGLLTPRAAEAGEVDRDDRVVTSQLRHDLGPLVPGLWPTVQQHDDLGAGSA